jgi:hypothetical protein
MILFWRNQQGFKPNKKFSQHIYRVIGDYMIELLWRNDYDGIILTDLDGIMVKDGEKD